MTTIKRFSLTLVLTLFALALSARAQTPRMSAVNITPDAEKIRVTSAGDVYQMTVEVSDEQGDVVFQSGQVAGQALDWKMKDSSGARVRSGTYLVAVTYRTSNGKLKKRVEQVMVEESVTGASAPSTPAPEASTSSPVPVKASGSVTAGRLPKFTSLTTTIATVADSAVFDNAGKVGIGTAAPAQRLHVYGPDGRLRLQSTNSGTWTVTEYLTDNHFWHTGVGGSTVQNGVAGKYYIYDATAGAFRMVIDTTGRVGIGTTNPSAKLQVESTTGTGVAVYSGGSGSVSVYGSNYDGMGVEGFSTKDTGVYGSSIDGVGVYGFTSNSSSYAGRFDGNAGVFGYLDVTQYTTGGSVQVCRNNTRLAVCSSSLRYKTAVEPFAGGLDLVRRLRPISFTWKSDGTRDLGFGAEDVATVEPLLVTRNELGQVEGVKYDRLNVVLVNAIKEQQARIERLEAQLKQVRRAVRRRAVRR
jgi:hypothetical protein